MMKSILPLIFMILLNSCNAQSGSDVTSLKYYAQTRGFLVNIDVNNKEIVYNNNHKIDTVSVEKEAWSSLKNLAANLELKKLKNYTIPEDLLATDRAIKAELTITNDNGEHVIEFIHGNPPEDLKEIIRELFSVVSE